MTTPIRPALDVQAVALTPVQAAPTEAATIRAILDDPFADDAPPASFDDIIAGLRAQPDEPGGTSRILQALVDLLRQPTEALNELPESELNELFHTVLRMARELSDDGVGRALVTLAIASFAHHLDWRSGGQALLAKIDPQIPSAFVQLAEAQDQAPSSIVGDRRGHGIESLGRSTLPGGAEEPLAPLLRLLIAQADGLERDPAATRVTMRGLFSGLIAGAEQDKADVMAQLRSGDLSEEGLMLLRERLQDANNLISVLNEILTKENEVLESIIRNFA